MSFSALQKTGKMLFQVHLGFYQHIPCLAALAGAYHSGGFQLVHEAAGPVVAELHPSLKQGGGTDLVLHDQPGCIFKQ